MINPDLILKLIALQTEFADDAIKNNDADGFRVTGTLCCILGCIQNNCMNELAEIIDVYNNYKIAQFENEPKRTVH